VSYRLRYVEGAHDNRFRTIRYPRESLPGIPTRERAEQALAAMPEPSRMEIEETED
jgi:hypothetical protein